MDSGLQVLISPPLITSKEHAEGYCACFPSELSSGQPLARGRLMPPVHYRRAHLPTCNSPPLPPCLNKVLSLIKNVRNCALLDSFPKGNAMGAQIMQRYLCTMGSSPNQGAMRGREEGRQVFALRNWLDNLIFPSTPTHPILLWSSCSSVLLCHSFLGCPQWPGGLKAFIQRNTHQKRQCCPLPWGQPWLTPHVTVKQEFGFLSQKCWMPTLFPSLFTVQERRGSRSDSFSLSTTRGASRSCRICAARLCEQVPWKLAMSWCKNQGSHWHIWTQDVTFKWVFWFFLIFLEK